MFILMSTINSIGKVIAISVLSINYGFIVCNYQSNQGTVDPKL